MTVSNPQPVNQNNKLKFDKTYTAGSTITIIINGNTASGSFTVMPPKVGSNYTGAADGQLSAFAESGEFTVVQQFTLDKGYDSDGFILKKAGSNTQFPSVTVTSYSVYEGTIEEYEGSDN